MPIKVKICGITDNQALHATVNAKPDFVGFVFYPHSPRYICPADVAELAVKIPEHIKRVGLFVNPSDEYISEITSLCCLDMIQLHGDEAQQRVAEIKEIHGLQVIKAIRVAGYKDIRRAEEYKNVADWLLFDTKSDDAYGGTGKSFDWSMLQHFKSDIPWMLSGGLDAENISQALSMLSPDAIDVSSGVEDSPGVKSPVKIAEFVEQVRISSYSHLNK